MADVPVPFIPAESCHVSLLLTDTTQTFAPYSWLLETEKDESQFFVLLFLFYYLIEII